MNVSRYYVQMQLKRGIQVSGMATALEVEYHTLTAGDIARGYIELNYQPVSVRSVDFTPIPAGAQKRDTDYKAEGQRVYWLGHPASVLEVGDILKIIYTRYEY